MIEKVVLDYLKVNLTVPVYPEKPETEPKRYVLIEKTGSSSENFVFLATFIIQSYAESLFEACKLNEEVKKVMDSMVALDTIGKAQLNTDYNFTDTTKKKYRYQAVYDLTY